MIGRRRASNRRSRAASPSASDAADLLSRVVPRLEIPVRTHLRVTAKQVALPSSWYEAESVTFKFEGREFGWIAHKRFPHQAEDEPPPGPTLTTYVGDTQEDWRAAREAAQRLLSALAFHYDARIEARASSGGRLVRDMRTQWPIDGFDPGLSHRGLLPQVYANGIRLAR